MDDRHKHTPKITPTMLERAREKAEEYGGPVEKWIIREQQAWMDICGQSHMGKTRTILTATGTEELWTP